MGYTGKPNNHARLRPLGICKLALEDLKTSGFSKKRSSAGRGLREAKERGILLDPRLSQNGGPVGYV